MPPQNELTVEILGVLTPSLVVKILEYTVYETQIMNQEYCFGVIIGGKWIFFQLRVQPIYSKTKVSRAFTSSSYSEVKTEYHLIDTTV